MIFYPTSDNIISTLDDCYSQFMFLIDERHLILYIRVFPHGKKFANIGKMCSIFNMCQSFFAIV